MTSIDATGAHASRLANSGRHDATQAARDRMYRVARRHTIFVRLLRVLLPVVIVAGFGFYALILHTAFGINANGKLRPGKIEITSSDLKMKNPSYFGVTKENGKYEVRAREAAVDFAMTGPVKLEGIDGDLLQANGVKTVLKATRGALDNKKGELELFDGVDVDASNGMRAQLERAMIYTKEHRVVSRDPVRAEMPTGTLTANSMDFSTDKRVGHFRGNVNLRLTQTPAANGARPSIGLGGDARQPVNIQSQEFDIDDLKSLADFRGAVVARQGDTQLTAPELHVTYEGQASAQAGLDGAPVITPNASASAAGTPNSGAQMSRLVARTGVVLTAGADRRVFADIVDFDVKADTALFTGNVELLQEKNVFRGGRLFVDRKIGKSRLDTPATSPKAPSGRIAATLVQSPEPSKSTVPAKAKASAPVVDNSNPFSGFQSDRGTPTDIEADSLEVNDQTKQAIFRGRVIAKQGGNIINTSEMIAHYTGQTGLMSGTSSDAGPKGAAGAQLTHIETKGGTKIVAKDGQEAEGANARFDMKANHVTMDGPNGVTLTQGQNKIGGCRLKMDMTKGEAHVENNCAGTANAAAAPTPAQLSIAAKPGVAPPAQPTMCTSGGTQACIIMYPGQFNQANDNKSKGQTAPPAATAPKPKSDAAQPQTSPSTVYRSN